MAFPLGIRREVVIDAHGHAHLKVTSDPVMLIGTDGGGIWRSKNFLSPNPDWSPVTDALTMPGKTRTELLRGLYIPNPAAGVNSVKSIDAVTVSGVGILEPPPPIVYAAAGVGLLKSPDNGTHWDVVYLNQLQTHFYNLVKVFIDPRDRSGQTVFALGRSADQVFGWATAIFKSTDGGVGWNPVTVTGNGYISDMEYSLRDGQLTLYATQLGLLGNQAAANGIYTVDEESGRWTKFDLDLVDVRGVGVDPSTVQWITLASDRTGGDQVSVYALAVDGLQLINVFRLDSSRSRFQRAGNGLQSFPTQSQSHAIGVSPSGAVYVGGNTGNTKGVWQLTDPNGTWVSIDVDVSGATVHGDLHAWGFSADDAGNEVVFNGNDGGIWRFDPQPDNQPGPGTWSSLNTPSLVTHLDYSMDLDPAGPVSICAASQDNGLANLASFPVWFWIAEGDSFRVRYDRRPPGPEPIIYYNGVIAVQGKYEVHLFRRALGSRNPPTDISAKVPSTDRSYLAYAYPFDIDPVSDALFLLGDRLWKSTDRGDSWHAISPSLVSPPLALDWTFGLVTLAVNGDTIWVADAGTHLLVTSTGDLSKHTSIDYGQFSGLISAIAIDPWYPTNVCIGTVNGNVFYSTDQGARWTDLTNDFPKGLWITSIALKSNHDDDPSMFVGTTVGVYTLVNVSELVLSWQPLGTGFPDVCVQELRCYPSINPAYGNWLLDDDNTNLFAATYGRGIFAIAAS